MKIKLSLLAVVFAFTTPFAQAAKYYCDAEMHNGERVTGFVVYADNSSQAASNAKAVNSNIKWINCYN